MLWKGVGPRESKLFGKLPTTTAVARGADVFVVGKRGPRFGRGPGDMARHALLHECRERGRNDFCISGCNVPWRGKRFCAGVACNTSTPSAHSGVGRLEQEAAPVQESKSTKLFLLFANCLL